MQQNTTNLNTLKTVFRGFKSIPTNPIKTLIVLILVFVGITIWEQATPLLVSYLSEVSYLFPMLPLELTASFIIGIAFTVVALLILYAFGRPIGTKKTERGFKRIGLTNKADEAPLLISRKRKRGDLNVTVREFDSNGISIKHWQDKEEEIGSVLNCHVLDFYEGKSRRKITIETVAHTKLPKNIPWKEKWLSKEEFVLKFGIGYKGEITCDLVTVPHILVGGSTGSGKTVLMRGLIHQCKRKGAQVYIADFKGGMDYPADWKGYNFITKSDRLLECLKTLTAELNERAALLNKHEHIGAPFPRIVVVIDEVAEVLDKTGVDAGKKKEIEEIERHLSTIARLGRGVDINLILGTQRPDATVLIGQIRNNIDFRVCGRAEETLSKIILDSKEASIQVPKNGQGRFVTNSGDVFQSYYFDK